MTNLPIFETAKVIESRYHPDAHIVLYHGLAQELLATLHDELAGRADDVAQTPST